MSGQGTCKHCRFFNNQGKDVGECRRRAPRDSLIGMGSSTASTYRSRWAKVSSSEWCGEFECGHKRLIKEEGTNFSTCQGCGGTIGDE